MRRWSVGLLVVLFAFAASAASAGAYGVVGTLVPVTVGPAAPGPATTMTVSFRLPQATTPPPGPVQASVTPGLVTRTDEVSVRGPARSAGCLASAAVRVPTAAQGTIVHVRLVPGPLGGPWCRGRFTGEVTQSSEPDCAATPHHMCPMYMTVPQIIGRFAFTVTAP